MNIWKLLAAAFSLLAFSASSIGAALHHDSILWQARRGGGVIYLLGTTHVGYKAQYPIEAKILRSFKKSKIYVTESITPFLSEKEAEEQLLKATEAEEGKTLKSLLQDNECSALATKENFEANLKKILGNVLSSKLLEYSPRATIYLASSYPSPDLTKDEQDKLQMTQGLEFYLSEQAKNLGIGHTSLDPEYWDGLRALTNSEMCNLAIGTASVHSADGFGKKQGYGLMKKARDLWLSGDSVQISQLAFTWPDSYAATHGDVEHKLFALRNIFMSNKIVELSRKEESPIFVAVGAAHLHGKNGILSKLRDAGFEVEPI